MKLSSNVAIVTMAFFFSGCSTFKFLPVPPASRDPGVYSIQAFDIKPAYFLSQERIDLFRFFSTHTTTSSTTSQGSGGVRQTTTYSYSSKDDALYSNLGVALCNGICVDLNGNIFLDIPRLLHVEERETYSFSSKYALITKNGSSVVTARKKIWGQRFSYEVSTGKVFSVSPKAKNLIIEEVANGFRQDTYSIFGKVSDSNYVQFSTPGRIVSKGTIFSNLEVVQEGSKRITIKSMYIGHIRKISLDLIDDRTVRIIVTNGLFPVQKSYLLQISDSMITLKNDTNDAGVQVILSEKEIDVKSIFEPENLFQMIFGSKKVQYSISIE